MTRLMSFCARPIAGGEERGRARRSRTTTSSAVGAYSNSGDSRATMKTPAVTMVAAWIRAETGVGPSIASGSQVCRPICADLPIAPTNSSMQVDGQRVGTAWPRKMHGAVRDIAAPRRTSASNCSEPKITKTREDAEREAEIADPVDDEGLDRRGIGASAGRTRSRSADRRQSPTPSQPKNICTKLSAVTSISMKKVNRLR